MSGTLDDLTDEQEIRFNAVMEQLRNLDVPELLLESARLRMPKPMVDTLKPRFRSNFAGAIASQKVIAYVSELHEANDRRVDLFHEITRLKQEADAIEGTDPEQARRLRVTVGRLAGMQEVALHRFASAIERISEFLPIATKTSGYKLSAADRNLLRNYVDLRDYFEHQEQRFPGGQFEKEACKEFEDERGWRVVMELPINKTDGMIEVRGSRVEISSDAAMDVTILMQRAWADLKDHALHEVQKHFLKHPEDIPEASEVRNAVLAQLGGILPYLERQRKEHG